MKVSVDIVDVFQGAASIPEEIIKNLLKIAERSECRTASFEVDYFISFVKKNLV